MIPTHVLLVDDEHMARARVRNLLKDYPNFKILDECHDGKSALSAIKKWHPDVVFLDIEMPGLTGLELLRQLDSETMPLVVFITAYNNYAVEAFNFFALDYLLKPFTEERFKDTIRRISQTLAQAHREDSLKQLQRYLEFIDGKLAHPTPKNSRISIPLGNRIYFINLDEIEYVTAASNYVNLHTKSARHVMRETLLNLQRKPEFQTFIRIHKSYLINPQFLKEVKKEGSGRYTAHMQDGAVLNISDSYKAEFFDRMHQG